ncbi:hypothetical protein VTO73DRAFT_11881 [Trametes versicolor]
MVRHRWRLRQQPRAKAVAHGSPALFQRPQPYARGPSNPGALSLCRSVATLLAVCLSLSSASHQSDYLAATTTLGRTAKMTDCETQAAHIHGTHALRGSHAPDTRHTQRIRKHTRNVLIRSRFRVPWPRVTLETRGAKANASLSAIVGPHLCPVAVDDAAETS